MPKYKTEKKVTRQTEVGRRFNKIMEFNEFEMTTHEFEIAKKFFMIGWHQSLLNTLDLIENEGEK